MTSDEDVTAAPGDEAFAWRDFRLIVDSITEYAIFVIGLDGRILSWNRGAERIFGHGASEILGVHFAEFYPPEVDRASLPQVLAAVQVAGSTQSEGWLVRKDGTRFWGHVGLTALCEDDGTLRGYANITEDLTRRHLEALRFRESEERFHHLVDAVTEYAIFMLDPGGHIVTWNSGAERTKGYRAEEIIGEHFSRFYTAEDRAGGKPERMLARARETGRAEDESYRLRKDGSRFWANVVIQAVRDAAGNLVGFAKVTRNLTERRTAEEELRRSEERFRLLVESVADYAIYLLDPEGRVTTWNLGAERMTGYSVSEILGQHFSRFFPPEDVQAGRPVRELESARDRGRFEDEGWRIRKDGSRFYVNVILTALRDAQGRLIGFAKITRDLTKQREAAETERNLLRAQAAREAAEALAAESEQANRIKDEFLATVSHELRTPLNAIIGWTTLLRERELDPSVAKGIEVIDRNAQAQVRIIEDLLDVSRIITGKLRIDPREVDLVAIAQASIEVVRPSATAKQISLDLERPPGRATLIADPDRLQQVVWNLLSNAVKFTPARGSVRVIVAQRGSSLTLAVADNGQGIERDFLPFVFDRFKQADSSTTRRHGGLGLGLALVRHIVELHGGEVSVESEGLGHGATFRIQLPVRAVIVERPPASPLQIAAPQPSAPRVQLEALRILVVDDDPDARELLRTLLTQSGAIAETAGDAAEAYDAFVRFQPDIVVSDIGMAGEDGYSLMRRLRSHEIGSQRSASAVALTAYTRNEDRATALAAGFDLHLGKPVKPDDLLTAIASLAAKRS